MDTAQMYTLLGTIVSVLGSTAAWNYYNERGKRAKHNGYTELIVELKKRNNTLETSLFKLNEKVEQMHKTLTECKVQFGILSAQHENLKVETEILRRNQ